MVEGREEGGRAEGGTAGSPGAVGDSREAEAEGRVGQGEEEGRVVRGMVVRGPDDRGLGPEAVLRRLQVEERRMIPTLRVLRWIVEGENH